MSDNLNSSTPDKTSTDASSRSQQNRDVTRVPDSMEDAAFDNNVRPDHLIVDVNGGVDFGATVTGRPLFEDDEGAASDDDSEVMPDGGMTIVQGPMLNEPGSAHDPEDMAQTIQSPAELLDSNDEADAIGTVMMSFSSASAPAEPEPKTNPDNSRDLRQMPGPGDQTVVEFPEDLDQGTTDDSKQPNANPKSSSGSQPKPGSGSVKINGSSGNRSGNGSSKFSSQIWTSSQNASVEDLITIRTRTVSGTGQFAQYPEADFEIVEKLAEGGMGVVYIARQKSLNRELAIKTLKSGAAAFSGTLAKSGNARSMSRADRQKREMFLSEALVTANLVHPNIIPIHELAQTEDGLPYYVMKRVHGIPWNKRVREMSLTENLDILHKVCDAIAYAHHHGVINRDLKPENIMLGEFGEVLVLDWGLAVPAPHAAEMNFRSPVASFGAGTPAYMSPELWSGPPEAIGECSDIYLLGAILFEIITGNPPHDFPKSDKFGAKSDIWKTIDTVLRGNVIREAAESGELIDIALKAMRSNPEERFGSVMEFQFAVRTFQRHEESRRLSSRATELIRSQVAGERDYHTCQTAAALYEEALRTWSQNGVAKNGLRTTRLIYANLASSKGDYDLGLQVATLENDSEFQALSGKLKSAKRLRSSIKWTALAAMLCVVALGAKSLYDNGIITNLNAEVTAKKQEARAAVEQAESAKAVASVAMEEADAAKLAADRAKVDANLAQGEADKAKTEAADSGRQAIAAKEQAATALAAAIAAKTEAEVAVAKAAAANAEVMKATEQLAIAEKNVAAALALQAKAESAARIAQVEIQTQSIRGLTLNENYADALREINRLLDGELLSGLPPAVREQRTAELKAQQEQLLRRAKRSEDPIQTQTLNDDGKLLAMGDTAGRVVVIPNPSESMNWPETSLYELKLGGPVSAMRFVSRDSLLLVSGSQLHHWTLGAPAAITLQGHENPIRGLDVVHDLAVTGDDAGHVIVWDLKSMTVISELIANTSIRDVAVIPGSRDFIYAGARGGQSSDILAYRIPPANNPGPPVRLGQLRMSRQHSHPPVKLSVAPDGSTLVISNSTNGDLIVLTRENSESDEKQNRFPFAHPADLEAVGDMSWLLSHHSRPVNDLQWASDARRLVSASDDRRIGLWSRLADSTSGTGLQFDRFVRGHGGRVTQSQFLNSSASRISSTSADGFSRLWDLETLDDDNRAIRRTFDLSLRTSTSSGTTIPAGLNRSITSGRVSSFSPASISPASKGVRSSTLEHADSRVIGLAVGYRTTSIAARLAATYLLTASPTAQDSPLVPAEFQVAPSVADADEVPLKEVVVLNSEGRQHRGSVRAVKFSSDGQTLVSGAADGSVIVWDTVSHEPITKATSSGNGLESRTAVSELFREGHEFNISRMSVIGAENNILATAAFDGTFRLWNMDLKTGRAGVQQQVMPGLGLVNTFAASPDGRFLVTSAVRQEGMTDASECSLWNLKELSGSSDPRPMASLKGAHRAEVTAIAVSSDSQRIATGGRDGVIAVWDAMTAQRLASLRAHGKNTIITSLKWLNDGSLLSAGLDGKLAQWSLEPVAVAPSTEDRAHPVPLEESASEDVSAHSPFQLRQRTKFERDKTPIEQIALAPDEKRLLVISVETNRTLRRTAHHVDCLTLDGTEKSRRITPSIVAGKLPHLISSAHWSPDGKNVLLSADKSVQIIETTRWRVTRVVAGGNSGVTDAQFLTSSSYASDAHLLLTFNGSSAALWNLESNEHLVDFRGPYPVTSVAFLEQTDRTLVLSAGDSLRVFEGTSSSLNFGKPLFHLQKSHHGQILSLAECPADPTLVLTTGTDGQVLLWRWLPAQIRMEKIFTVASLHRPVVAARWSPEGSRILLATQDGDILLMDRDGANAVTMRPTEGQDIRIATAEFSPGGEYLVVAGQRTRTLESVGWVLRVPDVGTGHDDSPASPSSNSPPEPISPLIECRFSGHEAGGISAVAFVADSPYLISSGNDGSLILWNWRNPLPAETPVAYEAYRFLADGRTTAHPGPITSLSVAPHGQICSAGDDGQIILWALPLLTHR